MLIVERRQRKGGSNLTHNFGSARLGGETLADLRLHNIASCLLLVKHHLKTSVKHIREAILCVPRVEWG